MKVAILQSNYIPWKGYFDLLDYVDTFVIYDCVQYTKNDWRNRNRLIVGGEPAWLTIPVKTKGKYHQAILDTEVVDSSWAERHWKTIKHCLKGVHRPVTLTLHPVVTPLDKVSLPLTGCPRQLESPFSMFHVFVSRLSLV